MTVLRARGFTLLELMVVVVIVAVLTAIALPAYRDYLIRTNRSQAKQFLQDAANREEQYRLDARSYTGTIGSGGLNVATPPEVAVNYTFTGSITGNDCNGSAVVAPAYVLIATAIGSQAVDGNLCLDNTGNKTPTTKWQK